MIFQNTGRNQVVYQSVWGGKEFPQVKIEPNAEKDPTSYRFTGDPEKACEIIKSVYKIENEPLFDRQYKRAISGDGDEKKKILTLHSSSRLALLTFYNISDENTLVLNIHGNDVEFNYSTFEFKNPVIGYPSNMDIVLVSKDRKTALFLESKFSEYYVSAGNKSAPISVQYATNRYSSFFYEKQWLESIGIDTDYASDDETRKKFVLSMKDGKINYLDGFKQMISHYISIRRRIDEPGKRITSDQNTAENREIADIILSVVDNPESRIYLGEIVFDKLSLPDGNTKDPDPQKVLRDYGELYKQLAKKMNQKITDDGLANRFVVLGEELKYSDLLKRANIEPLTADFYEARGQNPVKAFRESLDDE